MPTPVDLIGGYYADDTLPWSCQDTVNYLPVMAEVAGTLTPKYLKTPPGLKPYIQVGAGPIRGVHDLEGGRFVVSGQTLCRINPNGTIDPLGIIPGVGRVTMTHNQFKTGNQLLVENGQGGGGYVYDSTTGSFSKITDEGYPGSISSDYLDSYLLGVEPQGRFWFHSNLSDATDYNTLDRYEAESSPDRIVGLAVSGPEVVVFGQRTVDFFYNAGNVTGTFQSRKQPLDRGCASRHTIAKLDNSLIWLGDDGIVYRLSGYAAKPISTGPMHRAFSGLNWAEAIAFVWEDQGFKVYYLTFPDGHTWGYDVVSGLWTRRESFGLDRWRISTMVKWGRDWYGGDFQAGRIWQLEWDYVLEGDQEFISRRISPVMADNQNSLGIPFAELIFDTGQGPMTVAQAFPLALTITGNPPSTLVGLSYPTFSFVAGGGTAPYTFSISKGALPPGLSLSSTGVITGSATAGGTSIFTVRVFDSKQLWTEAEFSILAESKKLGLAIPTTLFTGGYESLSAYAPISSLGTNGDGAFGISPSTAYAAIGTLNPPFLQLYKLNTSVGSYANSSDIDSIPSSAVASIAFNPDGLHLAVGYSVGGTPRVNLYKFEGGEYKLKSFQTISINTSRITWSPNGLLLAVTTNTGTPDFGFRVFTMDPATSTFTGSASPSSGQNAQPPEGFGWSRDSKYIAEWSNNQLVCWEFTGAAVAYRSTAANGTMPSGRGAHFSDDGNFIYVLSGGNLPRMASFPVNEGVIGSQNIPSSQPPDAVSDSSFSGGYLAVGKNGNGAGLPQIVVYKCNGVSVTPIDGQPAGMHPTDAVAAIRWTI